MIDTGTYVYYNKSYHLEKSYFFKVLGIKPKSYIGQTITRIHDYYFKNSCLLIKDYKKYYKKEYSSFIDYLEKKHNLFQHEIVKLKKHKAYYSEKQYTEKFRAGELLNDDLEDNVISENILKIISKEKSSFEEFDLYED